MFKLPFAIAFGIMSELFLQKGHMQKLKKKD